MTLSGLAQNGRFRYWSVLSQTSESLYRFLFGMGMADVPQYLPGFARAYYCLGLIGLVLFFALCGHFWRHTKGVQHIIAIVYTILNIGSEIVFGRFTVLFIPFLLVHISEENVLDYSEKKKRYG